MSSRPPVDHPARARPLMGIAFKVAGTLLLTLMGALVKVLAAKHYPMGQIVFFRSIVGIIPVIAMILMNAERFALLRTRHPFAHVRRSLFGLSGLVTSYITVALLPFADATALSFSAPLFVVLFAVPFLGERVGPYRIGAVVVGFCGVLMISAPHLQFGAGQTSALGVAVGVLSAVCIALAQVSLRFAGRTERALTTVFYFSLCCTLASAVSLFWGWRAPGGGDLALLCLVGAFGGCAQILFTFSYRYADASALAPLDYLSLFWSLMIGLLVFRETPQALVIAGALIVVVAGLTIVLRERMLARRKAAALKT